MVKKKIGLREFWKDHYTPDLDIRGAHVTESSKNLHIQVRDEDGESYELEVCEIRKVKYNQETITGEEESER